MVTNVASSVKGAAAVARACGISRQALYLHFSSRTALITALVDHADREEALAEGIATVEAAPDGPAKVQAWAEMQASRNPRIAVLARVLDDTRSRGGENPGGDCQGHDVG